MHKIAIAGSQCAGKTEVANRIKELVPAPSVVKFAGPIYGILECLEAPKNRRFMQDVSDVAKKHFGNDIFVRLFFSNVEKKMTYSLIENSGEVLICDDVRYPAELAAIRQLGFSFIYVDADTEVRRKRAEAQGFEFAENHNSETSISGLLDFADYVIMNSSSDMGQLSSATLNALMAFNVPILN